MKRFTTAYIIRYLLINTTMRYHNIPIKMAKIKTKPNNMKNGTATLKDNLEFLTKLNILLPYDPIIVPLGFYPN